MEGRLTRRLVGALKAGIGRIGLDKVEDPRAEHGRRWGIGQLLKAVLVGLCGECRNLGEVEELTAQLSQGARQALGLGRRVPDTTMRDVVLKLEPAELQQRLWVQVRAAHRQKALEPQRLPFGVAAVDGKATRVKSWEAGYAQAQHNRAGQSWGLLRTMSAVLLSSGAAACLHVAPIPPSTNEDGYFTEFMSCLLRVYRRLNLFRLVVGDAGVCSLGNANWLHQAGLDYLFRLNEKQPTLLAEAERLLGSLPPSQAVATTEDKVGGGWERRSLFATSELAGYLDWLHLRVVLRVRREQFDAQDQLVSCHDRYYLSSLPWEALTPQQWLEVVRRYWATIENGAHHTLDTAFDEDRHPWIRTHDRGTLNILILRRLAFNLVLLFRGVTQRSEERRATAWKTLLRWFATAVMVVSLEQVAGLRPRREAPTEA